MVFKNMGLHPIPAREAHKEHSMSFKVRRVASWFQRMLPALILGSLVFLGGAPKAKANEWDDCNRRIAKAQWQLHEAVEYYGHDSRQARHWRHELNEEYEKQGRLRRKYHYYRDDYRNYDRRDYDNESYRRRYRSYDEDAYRDRNYHRDDNY